MESYIVRKTIDINASPEVVWAALTDPEKTKKYFFNCEVHSNWKKGGPISFKGKIMLVKKVEMHGTILDIEPVKLLKYSLENNDEGEATSTSTVTDLLTYDKGVTTVSITDDVGKGDGAEKRYERSEKGWDKILSGLKELVEEETA